MGDTLPRTPLRERMTGKWQIPALVLSLALLLIAVLQIEPAEARRPFEEVVAEIDGLHRDGFYRLTIDLSQSLLERESHRRPEELRPVHLHLARALFEQARREGRTTAGAAEEVIRAYEAARRAGVTLAGTDFEALAVVHEWLGEYPAALDYYADAIRAVDPPALELRQRAIHIRLHFVETVADEMHALLDAFIADAGANARVDLLEWAVERKVKLLLDAEAYAPAEALVESLRPIFEPTERRNSFEYLLCVIAFRAGQHDQAEAKLRALRNRLIVHDETSARAGWLLGHVVLQDATAQRPEEAISFFRDVVDSQASPLYSAASRLGLAEALAQLHRYEESLKEYRETIAAMDEIDVPGETDTDRPEMVPVLSREMVRSSITVVGTQLQQQDQTALALPFIELATSLADPHDVELLSSYLEQLGETQAALARSLVTELQEGRSAAAAESGGAQKEARRLLRAASETYLRLSRLNTLNETRSATAAWRAADLLDEAGDQPRTIELLRQFVRERPDDALTPRAWVRLGQSLQAQGLYSEAIEAYRECNRRFRRTLDANQSRVPLAECFMALGPDSADEAEKALRLILDDWQLFTPEAPEFRDALFMLGDLLNRQGRFEEAITTLEEAIERYPNDSRVARGLFLLADSYRLSGLALKEDRQEARFIGEREQLRREQDHRLTRAADLFADLIARYETQGETELGPLDALYLRHARLYRGDCLVELQRYGEALTTFERAAWIYKDTLSSLAAYVQIINCHVFLGQSDEAEAALRRAQYLVKTMPDQAFKTSAVPETRDEWKRYFDWIESADLF
jgi:tetratricopeptide (TPR) repeat protein